MMTGTTVNRPRTLASPDWAIARATNPRPEVADQVPRPSPQPAGRHLRRSRDRGAQTVNHFDQGNCIGMHSACLCTALPDRASAATLQRTGRLPPRHPAYAAYARAE
jgi:hypothetical protein